MRGKKLRDNGLWQASRMMLPEHKSAVRGHRVQLRERERPILDEQRVEELAVALSEALRSGAVVAVTAWGPLEDETTIGVVEQMDGKRIKVRSKDEVVWIPIEDIIDVRSSP